MFLYLAKLYLQHEFPVRTHIGSMAGADNRFVAHSFQSTHGP